MAKFKNKSNSGAKKRLKPLPSGKVKRKSTRRRHLMSSKNHKAKRQLALPVYVNESNMLQTQRLLNF